MTTQTEFNTSLLEVDVSAGIDNFIKKHGFKTDYAAMKACGLNENSIPNIRKTGGLSLKTLLKLGKGAGYTGREINIIIRVLGDFK